MHHLQRIECCSIPRRPEVGDGFHLLVFGSFAAYSLKFINFFNNSFLIPLMGFWGFGVLGFWGRLLRARVLFLIQ